MLDGKLNITLQQLVCNFLERAGLILKLQLHLFVVIGLVAEVLREELLNKSVKRQNSGKSFILLLVNGPERNELGNGLPKKRGSWAD